MKPDQSQAVAPLLSMTLSYIKPMTIKCALDLGIPDEICNYGQPMTLTQLHSSLSLPLSKKTHLYHLLRALTHYGFLDMQGGDDTVESEATYDLTATSRLVTNREGSRNLLPFVNFLLGASNTFIESFFRMGDWFRQDDKEKAFELAHGCTVWDMASQNSKLNDMFNTAMVSFSSTLSDAVIMSGAEIFEGVKSLVDVGGGTGGVAKAIAANFPHIQCTVLDLPHVVRDAPSDGIVKFVSGDMFNYIPPADAVLIKSILHSLGDEDCIKILKRCKEAIDSRGAAGSKVILIESVVGSSSRATATACKEVQLLFDMLMLNIHAGAERDENEWKALFMAAGFSSYKIVVTVGIVSIMEVCP